MVILPITHLLPLYNTQWWSQVKVVNLDFSLSDLVYLSMALVRPLSISQWETSDSVQCITRDATTSVAMPTLWPPDATDWLLGLLDAVENKIQSISSFTKLTKFMAFISPHSSHTGYKPISGYKVLVKKLFPKPRSISVKDDSLFCEWVSEHGLKTHRHKKWNYSPNLDPVKDDSLIKPVSKV